jgi:hypothetical protein
VLALASNDGVDLPWKGVTYHLPVQEVITHAVTSWHRMSAGEGAKGPRLYDWALVPLARPAQEGFCHWLLVRRSLDESDQLAAYLVFAPEGTLFETMVAVAGRRWTSENTRWYGSSCSCHAPIRARSLLCPDGPSKITSWSHFTSVHWFAC